MNTSNERYVTVERARGIHIPRALLGAMPRALAGASATPSLVRRVRRSLGEPAGSLVYPQPASLERFSPSLYRWSGSLATDLLARTKDAAQRR